MILGRSIMEDLAVLKILMVPGLGVLISAERNCSSSDRADWGEGGEEVESGSYSPVFC